MRPLVLALALGGLAFPAGADPLVKELLAMPPRGDRIEARLSTATIEPGAVGRWHTYPNHPVVYVAEGTVTVEFRDGPPKTFRAGEGFVEPVDTVLRGANKGSVPVRLVIFQLSPPEAPPAVDMP
ncbi:cupin domain-containing protein [Salinarimonas soli]|uniref:Cupin domain-containing protein n=1 Tax=Salinarimonas soli TaxID=1638099 RepID=A0A5B2VZ22_9HYPH|nr:cupin domain-containing protein [Salinarimonas soli]KAA2244275.1 cupin domain-containing protein [Salinarimonas soli]